MSESAQALPSALPTAARTLTFSEQAIVKTAAYAEAHPEETSGKQFRVFIQGGGCSGYSYGYKFDKRREGDLEFPAGPLTVLVDPASFEYIKGCTVDYKDSFAESGYFVQNPNATSTCGCGISFSTS